MTIKRYRPMTKEDLDIFISRVGAKDWIGYKNADRKDADNVSSLLTDMHNIPMQYMKKLVQFYSFEELQNLEILQ